MSDSAVLEAFRCGGTQLRGHALAAAHGPDAFFVQVAARLPEGCDRTVLAAAVRAAIERHEILRTRLVVPPGMTEPAQAIADAADEALQDAPEDAALAAARERAACSASGLVRFAVSSSRILVTAPAWLLDVDSALLLLRELAEGAEADDDEPLQFADVAEWQYTMIEPELARAAAPAYTSPWNTLERSGAFTPAVVRTPALSLSAGAEAAEPLLLTAWRTVLARLSGGPATVAVLCDGRSDATLRRSPGPFARLLALPGDLDPAADGARACGETSAALAGLRAQQDRVPLGDEPWDLVFEYHRDAEPAPAWPIESVEAVTEPFLLRLACRAYTSGDVRAELGYDTARVEHEHAAALAEQFAEAVAALCASPANPLAELNLLSVQTAQMLATAFTGETQPIPGGTVADIVLAWAARTPDAVAVTDGEGGRLTFAELAERADAVARTLVESGVEVGQAVAVMLPRGPELLCSLLGVLRAGAAYVPMDPDLPAARAQEMAARAEASVLISVGEPPAAAGLGLRVLDAVEAGRPDPARDGLFVPPAVHPLSLAYVLFTSGSTGNPKGVMITHEGFNDYLAYAVHEYRAGEGSGAPVDSPIGFDLTVTSLFAPLAAGRGVVLVGGGTGLGRVDELARTLTGRPGFSLAKLTPSTMTGLRQVLEPDALEDSARALVIGGEQLTYEMLADWRSRAPRTRLINEYGPTETVVGCCLYEVGPEDPDHGPVPIGGPIRNTVLAVTGAGGRPVAPGHAGELWVGGAGVARGYAGRPAHTAERFIPAPHGQRWYRTGDLVRTNTHAQLTYLGRTDTQIKIRGHRIEPTEIDTTLTRHPHITTAITIAREDTPGDKRLTTYTTLTPHSTLTPHDIHTYTREHLPPHLTPTTIIILKTLPTTPNGKIDTNALPAPQPSRARSGPGFVAPRTETETVLARVFAGVLGYDEVGVHDGFFALGGHSLLVTQAVTRIREELGVHLPLRSLFDTPTVAGLALALGASDGRAPLPPIRRAPAADGDYPLSYSQEMVWFLGQLAPEATPYNVGFAIRLRGRLEAGALERTLTEIVRRHELLHSSFPSPGGLPRQLVGNPWQVQLPVYPVDEEAVGDANATENAVQRHYAELAVPFDVEREPLVRWRLLRVGPQEHLLIQVEHHFIHDGWSVGRFLRELKEIYGAFALGLPHPLPELPIQFSDLTLWQRDLVRSGALEPQFEHWRARLGDGRLPALNLLGPRTRPQKARFRGAVQRLPLSAQQCERLATLAGQDGATLFMALYTVFSIVCRAFAQTEDIVVGSSSANRSPRETEELLGMVVNPLVLRLDTSGDPAFRSLLARAKEVVLDAFGTADLPFQLLVRRLRPRQEPGINPFFQVSFAFHDTPLPELSFPALAGRVEYFSNDSAKFDLNVTGIRAPQDPIDGTAGGYVLEWEYNTDIYRPEDIALLARAYRRVAEAVAENPLAPVSALVALARAARGEAARRVPGPAGAHRRRLMKPIPQEAS
jgi:amino acid adenylation domain-containing protein